MSPAGRHYLLYLLVNGSADVARRARAELSAADQADRSARAALNPTPTENKIKNTEGTG